jgi:diphthine synthase
MSIPTAVSQLLEALAKPPPTPSDDPDDPPLPILPVHSIPLDPSTTLAISLSRVGDPSQKFISGTLEEMSRLDDEAFGPPLHSFVIVGRQFHALERDFAVRWAIDRENFIKVSNEVYKVRD